ncbi:ComEC/Rec2 family competence protein [Pigmentibacter sp. JX0631]|uniref:ComEC/Rec2 family competence protein n=1 Tax=Pigmentibacter sp. JX0631 TaxID=2976982 RepID=UPI0024684F89|nr:ComEC/Rec2 family competence protein [Pigmentibacter sp. JX0631]WGL58518.1 ComEC/Rec2 family competence protein [Pigmentibacter sp. JX0631]
MLNFSLLIQSFIYTIICYLFTFCLIFFFQEIIHYESYFKNILDFSDILKNKSISIVANMQEKDLALNFLANIRKLTYHDKLAFEYSGLIHLLAISGSQVSPITNFLVSEIKYILYLIRRKNSNPLKLMNSLYQINIILSIIISFTISSLFGWSGALIRVLSISYVSKINFSSYLFSIVFSIFPKILLPTFKNCILLIFFSFIFGNLLLNFSFILSLIGVLSLKLIGRINNIINCKIFFNHIISTILTSFFIGVILFPFSNCNIFSSCLSNLIATPLVCFIITPLTFLVLIFPEGNIFSSYLIYFYDISLGIFKNIALIFSDNNLLHINKSKESIFSLQGLFYLNSILILLISTNDIIKNNNIFQTRGKFISIKIP